MRSASVQAPVIFSHSSARAVNDVPRNVPDNILQLLPKNGGVVMVTFVPGFLSPKVAAWSKLQTAEADPADRAVPERCGRRDSAASRPGRRRIRRRARLLADAADHIDHIRKVAGIDHIGLGGDFDGITASSEGLEDVSTYPALTAELLRRGYSDDDIKKIIGLNVLRVMREAEKVVEEAAGGARAVDDAVRGHEKLQERHGRRAQSTMSPQRPAELNGEYCFILCYLCVSS